MSIVCFGYPLCDKPHAGGMGGVAVHPPAGARISGDEPLIPDEHFVNEYGTTDCTVEYVRANVDDGKCSACGNRVEPPPTEPTEES